MPWNQRLPSNPALPTLPRISVFPSWSWMTESRSLAHRYFSEICSISTFFRTQICAGIRQSLVERNLSYRRHFFSLLVLDFPMGYCLPQNLTLSLQNPLFSLCRRSHWQREIQY